MDADITNRLIWKLVMEERNKSLILCTFRDYLSVLDPCRNRLDVDGLREVGNESLPFVIDAAKDLAQSIRDCGHFEPNLLFVLTTTADEN